MRGSERLRVGQTEFCAISAVLSNAFARPCAHARGVDCACARAAPPTAYRLTSRVHAGGGSTSVLTWSHCMELHLTLWSLVRSTYKGRRRSLSSISVSTYGGSRERAPRRGSFARMRTVVLRLRMRVYFRHRPATVLTVYDH